MTRRFTSLIMGLSTAVLLVMTGCGDSGSGRSVASLTQPVAGYPSANTGLTGDNANASGISEGSKALVKIVALPTATITDTTTRARVYLGSDDRFTISNNGTTLYGGSGYDTVTIAAGVTGVSLDQNVDQINLSGASNSDVFKQTGNLINIFDSTGVTLLAKAPVQDDSDGTILSFSDGMLSASLAAGGTMQLVTIKNPQVTIVTSKGTIVVELYAAKAPITARNFLKYVNEGFYSNTLFHRVISGFVVQGGGATINGLKAATHNSITLEAPSATGLTNAIGTIAMARTADLNSATSQFFFNLVDNNSSTGNNLDAPIGQGYAVFGSVITGMDVVQQIGLTPTTDQTLLTDLVAIISMTQTQ